MGPLQCISHIGAFTLLEVPKGGIVHQGLLMEYWGRKPSLGLGLSGDLFFWALKRDP